MIDTGSQTSAITRSLAYKLGLPIPRSPYQILGTSSKKAGVLGTTICTLMSRFDTTFIPLNPIVLHTIMDQLPMTSLPSHALDPRLNPLADTEYNILSDVNM